MDVNKTSEAVQITLNLLKTVNLPVSMMKNEGSKLIVAVDNLELIYKTVLVLENKLEDLDKTAVEAAPSEEEVIDT